VFSSLDDDDDNELDGVSDDDFEDEWTGSSSITILITGRGFFFAFVQVV